MAGCMGMATAMAAGRCGVLFIFHPIRGYIDPRHLSSSDVQYRGRGEGSRAGPITLGIPQVQWHGWRKRTFPIHLPEFTGPSMMIRLYRVRGGSPLSVTMRMMWMDWPG